MTSYQRCEIQSLNISLIIFTNGCAVFGHLINLQTHKSICTVAGFVDKTITGPCFFRYWSLVIRYNTIQKVLTKKSIRSIRLKAWGIFKMSAYASMGPLWFTSYLGPTLWQFWLNALTAHALGTIDPPTGMECGTRYVCVEHQANAQPFFIMNGSVGMYVWTGKIHKSQQTENTENMFHSSEVLCSSLWPCYESGIYTSSFCW